MGTPVSRQCFAFLLTNLVSVNSCFLLPAFRVLISCFRDAVPAPAAADAAAVAASAGVGAGAVSPPGAAAPTAPASGAATLKPQTPAVGGSTAAPATSPAASTSTSAAAVYDLELVHAVLCRIVTLVPTSVGVLVRELGAAFPHKSQPVHVQVAYLRSLCRISDDTAVCFENVMALIVERMVDIDVEINVRGGWCLGVGRTP
jgi:hypothetical protein